MAIDVVLPRLNSYTRIKLFLRKWNIAVS